MLVWGLTFRIPDLGRAGEVAAAHFLRTKGLVQVERNWRAREGELDIVCVGPKNELVVVEVKTSAGEASGAWEHLDAEKRKRVAKTAQFYLRWRRIPQDYPWRLDVVVVTGDPRRLFKPLRFTWVKAAF